MKKLTISFYVSALSALLMVVLAACGTASANGPTASASTPAQQLDTYHNLSKSSFQTLNDNADPTFNQLLGINNHGVIAGYFGSGANAQHPNKGYTLSSPYKQGNYHNENFPGSVQTQVTGINNHGDTSGFWVDGNGNNFGFIEWHGVFTSYKNPNTGTGTVNQLLGINDYGVAVGFYTDAAGVNHGYTLNQKSGKFSEILPPDGTNVTASGINNHGDVVGFFTAANKDIVSFLLKDGKFTEFDYPTTTTTTALGVNNNDQIVGVYTDAQQKMHGFLLSSPLHDSKWRSIDDPNGVGTTTINGLNDKGQLVGFYVDANGNTDGFLKK